MYVYVYIYINIRMYIYTHIYIYLPTKATRRSSAHSSAYSCSPGGHLLYHTALEATPGLMDGFFSQLPYKYHPEEVASVGE